MFPVRSVINYMINLLNFIKVKDTCSQCRTDLLKGLEKDQYIKTELQQKGQIYEAINTLWE